MIIITVMSFILCATLVLAIFVRLYRQLNQIAVGSGCRGLMIFTLFLVLLSGLLVATPAIVKEQFYPNGLPQELAIWKTAYGWYILATILMSMMFVKYLSYFSVKLNLFGESKAQISILPIDWDFKGVFLLISEMLSILVAIWQFLNLLK